MSITNARTPHIEEQDRPSRTNPLLIAVIAVLAVALAGLGAWVVDDRSSGSDEASDPQLEAVTELVDRLHDGLNERNADQVRSVFTVDAIVNETSVSTAYEQAAGLSDFERVSEVTELGDLDQGGNDHYVFVQQFVTADSGDLMRAPMLVELDDGRLSRAEWVPGFFVLTD